MYHILLCCLLASFGATEWKSREKDEIALLTPETASACTDCETCAKNARKLRDEERATETKLRENCAKNSATNWHARRFWIARRVQSRRGA